MILDWPPWHSGLYFFRYLTGQSEHFQNLSVEWTSWCLLSVSFVANLITGWLALKCFAPRAQFGGSGLITIFLQTSPILANITDKFRIFISRRQIRRFPYKMRSIFLQEFRENHVVKTQMTQGCSKTALNMNWDFNWKQLHYHLCMTLWLCVHCTSCVVGVIKKFGVFSFQTQNVEF